MIDSIEARDRDLPPDAETMARLLRLAGMRPEVPADGESRVRQAFLDECRSVSRTRAVRRRVAAAAATLSMAAAALLAIRLVTTRDAPAPLAEPVAIVERMEGESGLRVGHVVRIGDRIDSGATSRISVRLTGGASVRFDRASKAQLVSATRIELHAGAVYIDSGTTAPSLEIGTAFGLVRDIGTQFEIRVEEASLRVRVRSGLVEVQRGEDVSSARPGAELTVTREGVTSQAISPYGESWAWTTAVGPVFDIEGRSLSAYLEYVCREQGWALVYADSRLALDASGIILHGSTQGLPASDALSIVLATTGLTHRLDHGQLQVARAVRP